MVTVFVLLILTGLLVFFREEVAGAVSVLVALAVVKLQHERTVTRIHRAAGYIESGTSHAE